MAKPIDTIYLHNFDDTVELPEPEVYLNQGMGINVCYQKITEEVVQLCHEKGQKVGIWIDALITHEDN